MLYGMMCAHLKLKNAKSKSKEIYEKRIKAKEKKNELNEKREKRI